MVLCHDAVPLCSKLFSPPPCSPRPPPAGCLGPKKQTIIYQFFVDEEPIYDPGVYTCSKGINLHATLDMNSFFARVISLVTRAGVFHACQPTSTRTCPQIYLLTERYSRCTCNLLYTGRTRDLHQEDFGPSARKID